MVKIINKKNVTDSNSLKIRIKFNKKYSKYNFDKWINNYYDFKNKSVLDIGCGDGKQINSAIKQNKKNSTIIGVDLSLKSLEKISLKNKKNKNLKLINANMDNLKKIDSIIKNKKFDLIHSTYAFYYSKNPMRLIKYLKTKLKKNSRLIITMPVEKNTLKNILNIREDNKKLRPEDIKNYLNKNFDMVQINYLNNYQNVNSVKDLVSFYRSSGIYNENKLKFFSDYIKKKLSKDGYIKLIKSSVMFIGFN